MTEIKIGNYKIKGNITDSSNKMIAIEIYRGFKMNIPLRDITYTNDKYVKGLYENLYEDYYKNSNK